MAQSKSHADPTSMLIRKCIFVASKELAWVLNIETEQLECDYSIHGGRDVFALVPQVGVGKASAMTAYQ